MKSKTLTAMFFRGLALLALLGIAVCNGGCGTEQQCLTLQSTLHNHAFLGQFANAYMTRAADGNVDVVLIDNAAQKRLDGHPADAPTQQVMHFRVLWNPKRDQKSDHNSALNATVNWYVLGNTTTSEADVLEYAGTAFVSIDDSMPAELTIRNAAVHPVACRGDLCDPIGSCQISGTIHAREDRHRVRQVLSSVRTAIADADAMPNTFSSAAKPESPSSLAR